MKKVVVGLGLVALMGAANAAETYRIADVRVVVARKNAVTEAAERELKKHLALVGGWQADGKGLSIVLGRGPEGTGPATNFESRVAFANGRLYCWGDDRKGAATPRYGTLFAVYRFLDEALGVRWVTAGDDGIVFTPRETFAVPERELDYRPPLVMMTMRRYSRPPVTRPASAAPKPPTNGRRPRMTIPPALGLDLAEATSAYDDYGEWLLRQLHTRREKFSYCHAFTDWRNRFFPQRLDWFGLDPVYGDRTHGFRGLPPRFAGREKLCVSNPAVLDQIVADWRAAGRPKYLNVCPNDGTPGFCHCEKCCALDTRRPGEAFLDHLTDRYLWFWNRIAARVVSERPDVVLVTYVYSYYRHMPRRERIEYPDNFLGGLVPQLGDDYEKMFAEWKTVGLKHFFLRPNYLCYDAAFPRGIERYLYKNLHDAIRAGAIGFDYDGGIPVPALEFETYVVGRALSRPELSFETIADEFYSQYGAAADVVRRYYEGVRARGEKTLSADGFRKISHSALDDSEIGAAAYRGNTAETLAAELALVKSAPTEGLRPAERRRLANLVTRIEHLQLTLAFLAAGNRKDAAALEAAGRTLYDFRLAHRDALGLTSMRSFTLKSGELAFWQELSFFRDVAISF